MKIFKSFDKLREFYFPKTVKKEKLEKIMKNPEEYGRYLANVAINKALNKNEKTKTNNNIKQSPMKIGVCPDFDEDCCEI